MAMKNHKRSSIPRLMTSIVLTATLVACSSAPEAPRAIDITLEPNQAIATYLMRADSNQGDMQNDWLIMALKASVESNDTQQAQRIFQRLQRQKLKPKQSAQVQLSYAKILQQKGLIKDALETLSFSSQWSLEDKTWLQYHQLRASLFLEIGDQFNAAKELTSASRLLSDSDQQTSSQEVWKDLSQYTLKDLEKYQQEVDEPIMSAWITLAIDFKKLSHDLPTLKTALKQWLIENPQHPAALYTPESIETILNLEITQPKNIALLLPLTGKFSKQAQLIRDGFIFEMMNSKNPHSASLTVIDTNKTSVENLEPILLEKKIDAVVGPLLKGNIEKFQNLQQNLAQSISTLALNIPKQFDDNIDMCFLTLSPEQEVAQAARHLAEQGAKYPMILAPKGTLGDRVVNAFEKEWNKHSTHKVAISLFGDRNQLQRNINQVFGLQDSQQQIAQMSKMLNIPLETQPRSRRDIDAVYIVANSAEITLIKPFIEVAINPDTVPPKLYANSRSNNGQQQYEDLSGVMFSDIPLLLRQDDAARQINTLWPNHSNAEIRLQALGMDAYQLIEYLPQMKLVSDYTLDGNTGQLTIGEHCLISRELSWTQYIDKE